jgi:hypothetical protein
MSDQEQPRWDLLPRRPEEFFELPTPYDLTALKRRYNALIRRFKPERFPAEFQKIRAAYERLSDDLRYARASDDGDAGAEADWPVPSIPTESAPRGDAPATSTDARDDGPVDAPPRRPAPGTPALDERLDAQTLMTLYEELRDRAGKSPRDYIQLALMSDVAAPDDPLGFARWLLAGLGAGRRAGPRADKRGLWRLAREYFAGPIPAALAPALLELAADHVRADRYYWLTEALWLRYLREVDFRQFSATLRACEARIVDARATGRVSFYTRLVPAAMWKADPVSIRDMLGWIDDACREADFSDDRGLRLVDLLADYHAHRGAFLDGGHARHRMDQALADYCGGDPLVSRRALLECQHWIAHHPRQVEAAFPRGAAVPKPALLLWWHATRELEEELDEGGEEWCHGTRGEQVARLIGPSNRQAARCPMARANNALLLLTLLGLVGGVVLLVILLCLAGINVIARGAWGAAGWNLLGMLGVVAAFVPWLAGTFWVHALTDRQQYQRVYRPALLQFLRDAWAPLEEITESIEISDGQAYAGTKLADGKDIARAMRGDVALMLHAAAWRLICLKDRGDQRGPTDASAIDGLDRYRVVGLTFLDGSLARRRIHDVLVAQADDAPDAAARAFLDCQQWLAAHPEETQRAFPSPKSDVEVALTPWRKIADALEPATPPRLPDAAGWTTRDRAGRLVWRLAKDEESGEVMWANLALVLGMGSILVVLIGIVVQLLRHAFRGEPWQALFVGGAAFAWLMIAYWLLDGFSVLRKWALGRRYRDRWRNEIFMLVDADARRIDAICEELATFEDKKVEGRVFSNLDYFLELVRDDAALEFFSIAQRFKR